MLFVSFNKGPGGFPYVFIITGQVPTLIPVDGITLGDHRVFVLGGDQEVLDGVIHKPAPEPGGWGAVLRAFCSKYSM